MAEKGGTCPENIGLTFTNCWELPAAVGAKRVDIPPTCETLEIDMIDARNRGQSAKICCQFGMDFSVVWLQMSVWILLVCNLVRDSAVKRFAFVKLYLLLVECLGEWAWTLVHLMAATNRKMKGKIRRTIEMSIGVGDRSPKRSQLYSPWLGSFASAFWSLAASRWRGVVASSAFEPFAGDRRPLEGDFVEILALMAQPKELSVIE